MIKLNLLLSVMLSVLLITSAQAGSLGLGASGNIASVSANGTETEGTSGSETENSVMTATAGNNFMFGSVYGEYAFGENENFVFGIDYVPFSADINSKTLSRTDASQGAYTAQDTGTVKANAEISDHTTWYAELGLGAGVYVKAGYAEVDIDVRGVIVARHSKFEEMLDDADIYVFDYISTAFNVAAATSNPVLIPTPAFCPLYVNVTLEGPYISRPAPSLSLIHI